MLGAGFHNRLVEPDKLLAEAQALALAVDPDGGAVGCGHRVDGAVVVEVGREVRPLGDTARAPARVTSHGLVEPEFTADPNGVSSGASYVVFGREGGFDAELDLSSLEGGELRIAAQPVALPVTGTIEMQSTGQAGTHSSQPVHCDSTTVCISFAAPTMQSTGQALMHSVQPMHQASSMTASARGPARG